MKQSTLFSILSFLHRNFILILFMAFFAAWSSCSKDLSPLPIETRSIVANYNENPLFDTSSLLLSRIYQDLHTKNTADSFLNYLYETYGSFVWQASFIQKTSDSLPLMIVPLVRNNDVTALLFVQPMSNNRYIYNLVDRDYIVNNNALTSGTGLSKKLAYTRLYLLNTFRKNLFCIVDSSYVQYGNAIRDSMELEERYDIKMPMLIWEECCPPETRGCYSIGGSWGKFVWGYFVLHYPDIPSGSNNGFGHNDDFNYTGGGNIWDPHSGQGGGSGGGGDPLSGLGFYVKKQLKSHLLKLKTVYGFSQSIEQLLPMVYSCYTIDPDFDEVTFDDDCAIAGIASRYLDAIQYSGNYAVAVGWLSGHVSDLVALMDHVEDHVQETGIKSYHDAMLDLLDNNEGYVRQRFFELWDLVQNDPYALVNGCESSNPGYPISFWSTNAQFIPPQAVKDKINQMGEGWRIQYLSTPTLAPSINLDYFPVTITKMPIKDTITGERWQAQDFFQYIRKNINDFVNTNNTKFTFTSSENAIWQSSNPFLAVSSLDVKIFGTELGDDGSVICAEAQGWGWVFTTLKAPQFPNTQDGYHPVSGNREFAFTDNPNGSFTFYTKGVDRYFYPPVNGQGHAILAYLFEKVAFDGADGLWSSFQDKIEQYVNNHGGTATKSNPIVKRPKVGTALKALFKGNTPITNSILCD